MRRHPEGWFDGLRSVRCRTIPCAVRDVLVVQKGTCCLWYKVPEVGADETAADGAEQTDGTHYCLSCPLPDETLQLPKWRQWLEAEHLHLNPDSVTETWEHVVMACRGTSYGAPALEASAGSGCTPSLTEGQATRRRFPLVPLLGTASATASASATGRPKMSKRPPKAIEHIANQAQPSRSPATTSVNQWTPRNTRVAPTIVAVPAAERGTERLHTRRPPPRGEQRDRGECRSGGGGVTGREGRSGEAGESAEIGTGPLHEVLDAVGQRELTGDHQRQEHDHGSGLAAATLDGAGDECHQDHPPRPAEFAEMAEEIGGKRRGVFGTEAGEAHIDRLQSSLGTDHRQQHPDAHRGRSDDCRRDDQGDSGLGLRVEVVTEMTGETRVPHDLLGDRPARHVRVRGGRPADGEQRDHAAHDHTGTDRQQEHHSPLVTPIGRRVCLDP